MCDINIGRRALVFFKKSIVSRKEHDMFKGIALILASAAIVSAIPSAATAAEKIGGTFFVTHYRGLPGMTNRAVTFDAKKFDQLAFLKNVCDQDLRAQRPGAFKEVLYDVGMAALGSAAGLAVGVAAAGIGDTAQYAAYGAGAGGGSGLAGSITGRSRANRSDIGQCMSLQLQWAQKFDGQLLGVGVIMNYHSVNGKGISRPEPSAVATAAASSTSTPSSSTDLANDDAATTPR